jgi:alanine dehydrogenase
MLIGVPKEIKPSEDRVALTPAGASELVKHGHAVYVQESAGLGSGFPDSEYADAGATLLSTIEEVYATANMIMKVCLCYQKL